MEKSRKSQFFASRAAADCVLRLEHNDRTSRLRHSDGRSKPVRPRTDHGHVIFVAQAAILAQSEARAYMHSRDISAAKSTGIR